jgi:hypothetical protein
LPLGEDGEAGTVGMRAEDKDDAIAFLLLNIFGLWAFLVYVVALAAGERGLIF